MSQPMELEAEGNVQKKLHWDKIDMLRTQNVLFTFQELVEKCAGRARGLAVLAQMKDAPPTPLSALSGDIARYRILSFEVISYI